MTSNAFPHKSVVMIKPLKRKTRRQHHRWRFVELFNIFSALLFSGGSKIQSYLRRRKRCTKTNVVALLGRNSACRHRDGWWISGNWFLIRVIFAHCEKFFGCFVIGALRFCFVEGIRDFRSGGIFVNKDYRRPRKLFCAAQTHKKTFVC